MDKWKGRYLMAAGVLLQACAALGFGLASESGICLIFTIPLALVSLGTFSRGWAIASRENDVPPLPAASQPRLEEMILALQEDVNRLREDREFYRELYADGGVATVIEEIQRRPAQGREVTYRPVPERVFGLRPPSTGR